MTFFLRNARILSLTALCCNFTLLSLLMHISRVWTDPRLPRYKASSAVVLTELGKLLCSIFLAVKEVERADELQHWGADVSTSNATVLHGLGLSSAPGTPEANEKRSKETPSPRKSRYRSASPVTPTKLKKEPRRVSHGRSSSVDLPNLSASQNGGATYMDEIAEEDDEEQPVHRLRRLQEEVFARDWWKLGLPALLFTLQANLQYTAVANLSVPVFQCTSQLKILSTALCSVLLLKRTLTTLHWLALLLLTAGVALVQLDTTHAHKPGGRQHAEMNQLLGMSAMLASCLSSGFASTYFELQLKRSKQPVPSRNSTPREPGSGPPPAAPQTGLWVRNVQLSLFGLCIALGVFGLDTARELWRTRNPADPALVLSLPSLTQSFFLGFTPLVYLVVAIQIAGGLLAALVIKHADNLLKNFATSFSILLSFAASVVLFDFQLGLGAVGGAVLVLISTWLFNSKEEDRARTFGAIHLALTPFMGKNDAHTPGRQRDVFVTPSTTRSSSAGRS